jgi:hypothetical protein
MGAYLRLPIRQQARGPFLVRTHFALYPESIEVAFSAVALRGPVDTGVPKAVSYMIGGFFDPISRHANGYGKWNKRLQDFRKSYLEMCSMD